MVLVSPAEKGATSDSESKADVTSSSRRIRALRKSNLEDSVNRNYQMFRHRTNSFLSRVHNDSSEINIDNETNEEKIPKG